MDEAGRKRASDESYDRIRAFDAAARARWPFLRCGFECAGGWQALLEAMLEEIAPHVAGTPFRIVQVKEKFGGLRVYYEGLTGPGARAVEAAIERAEARAASTCEVTGEPGELCVTGGWYRTLSPSQHEPRTRLAREARGGA